MFVVQLWLFFLPFYHFVFLKVCVIQKKIIVTWCMYVSWTRCCISILSMSWLKGIAKPWTRPRTVWFPHEYKIPCDRKNSCDSSKPEWISHETKSPGQPRVNDESEVTQNLGSMYPASGHGTARPTVREIRYPLAL